MIIFCILEIVFLFNKKKMLKFLSGFLLLQLLYHVIVVGVSYGIHWISQTHLAILRDVIWILMI